MKNIIAIIAVFLFSSSSVLAQDNYKAGDKALQPATFIVAEVIDGDTIKLANGEVVELIGIDAAEIETEEGKEAKGFVASLIENFPVRLK